MLIHNLHSWHEKVNYKTLLQDPKGWSKLINTPTVHQTDGWLTEEIEELFSNHQSYESL